MTLANDYKRQFGWRNWSRIFAELPSPAGQTVLDLGCAVGDQAAELAARGAMVIGFDSNEELLEAARSRGLAHAEFRFADLRQLPDLGTMADGIWCSFAAAYFTRLDEVLPLWSKLLRPGGWIAVTEIDDLFGHEPLSARTKALFESYAREALTAGRYDFHMGHKLSGYLERGGFKVSKCLTVDDQELSFIGPASMDVLEAWGTRLEWMKLLHIHCGDEYSAVRDDFLSCLMRDDHRSAAKVYCCIATK